MNFTYSRLAATLFLLAVMSIALPAAPKVQLGIDTLAANNFKGLEGKRVGLITNPSGVNAAGQSTIDILRNAPGVKLVALFAPEHGVYGDNAAGAYVPTTTDARTGLVVNSLFGPTRKPTPEMLKGLDVLIYDLQDIGCRSYTYISTLGLAMEAAGAADIDFYVLDRPNPLGGNRVEGMPLDPKFRNFLAQWEIPYIYGMTSGELANMIFKQKWISTLPRSLMIVPMKGWYRSMTWEDTGLMWVPTSPHIPTVESAMAYAITGLLPQADPNVNNGVGYTLPFSLCGNKDWNSFQMAEELDGLKLPGLFFRPVFYKPFYGPQREILVQGVQIYVTDKEKVNLTKTSLILLDKAQRQGSTPFFAKATDEEKLAFDQLCGTDVVRITLARNGSMEELANNWTPDLESFRRTRKPYLIYADKKTAPVAAPSAPAKP